MWLAILHSVMGNSPRRRRAAQTDWSRESAVESLEIRTIPSCIEPGVYFSPGDPDGEFGPTTLTVNPDNEEDDQIAFLNNETFGNVRMRVICKKNGRVILKTASTPGGVKGKIVMNQTAEGQFQYVGMLNDDKKVKFTDGTFTKES